MTYSIPDRATGYKVTAADWNQVVDAANDMDLRLGTGVTAGSSVTTQLAALNLSDSGKLAKASNLSDVANAATALANLSGVATSRQVIAGTGLTGGGTLAADRTLAVSYGTAAGTAAQGNDSRITITQDAVQGNAALAAAKPVPVKWTNGTNYTVASTTAQTIFSGTITPTKATNKVTIVANFDLAAASGLSGVDFSGPGCLVVNCLVDGVAQTEQIIFGAQSITRLTAGQTWVVTNLSVASHTISFTAALATQPASNPSYRVYSNHTGATVTIING